MGIIELCSKRIWLYSSTRDMPYLGLVLFNERILHDCSTCCASGAPRGVREGGHRAYVDDRRLFEVRTSVDVLVDMNA